MNQTLVIKCVNGINLIQPPCNQFQITLNIITRWPLSVCEIASTLDEVISTLCSAGVTVGFKVSVGASAGASVRVRVSASVSVRVRLSVRLYVRGTCTLDEHLLCPH